MSDREIKDFTELMDEPSNGLVLRGLIPGSLADQAGLQVGDEILEVNGHKVTSLNSFVEARNSCEHKLTMVCRRNEDTFDVSLDLIELN